MTETATTAAAAPAAARLSTLDRLLPVWIGAAMAAGLLLGRLVPGLGAWLGGLTIDGLSLPIALGHGAGAEARAPLGITVVGGLAVSQVITLFLTPVIYLYMDRLQSMIRPKPQVTAGTTDHGAPVVQQPAE